MYITAKDHSTLRMREIMKEYKMIIIAYVSSSAEWLCLFKWTSYIMCLILRIKIGWEPMKEKQKKIQVWDNVFRHYYLLWIDILSNLLILPQKILFLPNSIILFVFILIIYFILQLFCNLYIEMYPVLEL